MPNESELSRASIVAEWAGVALEESQLQDLARFEDWLVNEAVVAGGIGPNEADKAWERHVVDSLLFLKSVHEFHTVLDVGSGVGLPGIPLAIALPNTQFTLLDRSGRRCELAARATRVLGLDNVSVRQGDLVEIDSTYDCAVSRASLSPNQLLSMLQGVAPFAVAAGSRIAAPTGEPGWTSVEIPEAVAGEKVWILEAWISAEGRG